MTTKNNTIMGKGHKKIEIKAAANHFFRLSYWMERL